MVQEVTDIQEKEVKIFAFHFKTFVRCRSIARSFAGFKVYEFLPS